MVLHLRAEITHDPKKLHCLKLYISVPHKKGHKICALVSLGFHELLARCPLCNIKRVVHDDEICSSKEFASVYCRAATS